MTIIIDQGPLYLEYPMRSYFEYYYTSYHKITVSISFIFYSYIVSDTMIYHS